MSFSFSVEDLRRNLFVNRARCSIRSKSKRRAILKNGDSFTLDSPKRKTNPLQSVFTVLVQMELSYTLFVFLTSLLSSWLIFAVLWWLICYTHGDFEPNHLPAHQLQSNFTPCIHEIYGFISCFLFSIETQHTVGYGIRATTEECPEAIFLNAFQCILGTILQGIMSGIIFTKLTLPNKRASTVIFSKNAVVSLRDGFLHFMFRVGDIRHNHVIESKIKVLLTRTVKTFEGEVLKLHRTPLDVRVDDCKKGVPLMWPVTVSHKIDAKSPFFDLNPQRLKIDNFEIIVVLEGCIESTGQSMQARTSYLPTEILWGYRFEPVLKFSRYLCEYEVDYSKFENVVAIHNMPLLSAKELMYCESKTALMVTYKVENGFVRESVTTIDSSNTSSPVST